MNRNFKKLALAGSIAAGLAAMTGPAQAVMIGDAGEALLVPMVTHSDGQAPVANIWNTYITVRIPGTVGFDTIPNFYTAPNTTPTNPGPALFPAAASLDGGNFIHWYYFDDESVHRLNGRIPVTAEDEVYIDWSAVAGNNFIDQAGYMVIATEIARTGAAADFDMYGEAYVALYNGTVFNELLPIPVLPMSDGADGPTGTAVSVLDNVKYSGTGIPNQVSPLGSGMRTNRSDGDGLQDFTAFDLSMGDRRFPAYHVVWLDVNLGAAGRGIDANVYDSEELACSTSVDLPIELNVIEIPEWDEPDSYCLPVGTNISTVDPMPGFMTYYLPEYIDTGIRVPESSGVAFSIAIQGDTRKGQGDYTISPAGQRGTYK